MPPTKPASWSEIDDVEDSLKYDKRFHWLADCRFGGEGCEKPPERPEPKKGKMSNPKKGESITFVEKSGPASPRREPKNSNKNSGVSSMLLNVEQRDSQSGPKVSTKAQEILERKRKREEEAARKRAEAAAEKAAAEQRRREQAAAAAAAARAAEQAEREKAAAEAALLVQREQAAAAAKAARDRLAAQKVAAAERAAAILAANQAKEQAAERKAEAKAAAEAERAAKKAAARERTKREREAKAVAIAAEKEKKQRMREEQRAFRREMEALLPPIHQPLTRRAVNPLGLSLTFDIKTVTVEEKKNPMMRGVDVRPEEPERGGVGLCVSRNSTGFRLSIDFKKLLAAIPRPRKHPKGDAVFGKNDRVPKELLMANEEEEARKAALREVEMLRQVLAEKAEEALSAERRLTEIETESRSVKRKLITTIEEVKAWQSKSETIEQKLSVSVARLAEGERKLASFQKLVDKKDVEITTLTRQLNAAIEEVKLWKSKSESVEERLAKALEDLSESMEQHAAEELKRKAVEKQLEALRLEMQKESEKLTQQLATARQDADEWKSRNESLEERLQQALAKIAEEEELRKSLEMDVQREREEKANFQADMKSTLHALKVSEEAATALRESESSLTDAVVSYAEEIKDLRAQLSAMRTDRDQEKTAAKESRVQNGVLRMRLAAAASKTSSTSEVEHLQGTIAELEKAHLDRAAEEVRKIAALEAARDEALASVEELKERMESANANFTSKLGDRDGKIRELEEEVEFLKTTLEGEKEKMLRIQAENKDSVRTTIIRETELRETKVKETLRETHRIEMLSLVEKHAKDIETNQQAHADALAAAVKARDEAEAALASEKARHRKDVTSGSLRWAAAENRANALAEELAGLKADLATEKDAREVEKWQYDRTAESAAAALEALKQEIEQLNVQLEQERDGRRGDRVAAKENLAAERDAFHAERAELKKSLEKERAARESENAKAAAEVKRLKDLVEWKEGEISQLQEEMGNLRDEFESKAQKVQSEVSTHTTVITTIKQEKNFLQELLSAEKELRLKELEDLNDKLSAAKVTAAATKWKLNAALMVEKKSRAQDKLDHEKAMAGAQKDFNKQKSDLEKSLLHEQSTRRWKVIEKAVRSKGTEDALKKFNEESSRLENLLAAEKEARRAEQDKFAHDSIVAKSIAETAKAEVEAQLFAEQEARKEDATAAAEAAAAQLAQHREAIRALEIELKNQEQQLKGEMAKENDSFTAMLDASKLEKVQLQAQVVKLKEAAKAQMSRSAIFAQEAEQAWAAERDKLEARIVQITAESTALTMRITLLEEQKAQVEKDLQDEREARESDSQRLTAEANDADDQYAASIAELEAKLEEANRKLMSLERSEQYLKASLEDSNKQAGQVTSLKEELELVRSEEKNLRDEFAALERKLATQQAESQSKIQELNSLLELERSAHATLRKEMKEMRAELDAAKKTIEDLRSALAEAEAKAEKLGEEHQAALRAEQQRFLDETSATREELMKERDDATARLGQMATRIAGLEAQIDELEEASKAQVSRSAIFAHEAEQAWAAERDKLETRIMLLTAESTTMTARITLLEEQKAQMEKDLQDDYAASIAELEAKLEEDNRKLMSLEHSEQYLKASLEDSNNKQAEQVTSLKEELEKLNGKLSSAKVATAATKWKLKAAHEAEKKAQMSRSAIFAHEAEQAWAAERDKLEARIAQLTAGSTTMKEAEQAWAAERDKLEARIVQITSESTTMTTRITLLEEQKAQVEKDLQDEREARESDSQRLTAEANDADDQYAASIAELEAKLEELSKALKAAEEDSNKQAGQVTSLKEELELVRSEEKNLRDEFAALERKLATQQAESQSKIQELNSLLELERSAHATLREELVKERAARESENAKAAAEVKRLKDLVEKKEEEISQLQEEMGNLRDEFESKAQKVQSEVSTHTTVITTIKQEKHTLEKLLSAEKELRLKELEELNDKLSAAKVTAAATKWKLNAALMVEKKSRAQDKLDHEKAMAGVQKDFNKQKSDLEKSLLHEQTTKRKEIENVARSKGTEDALKKFNEESSRLENLLAAEKEARRAEQDKFAHDSIVAKSIAETAKAEVEAQLFAEQEARKEDATAAAEAAAAQLAQHREAIRALEIELKNQEQQLKGEMAKENDSFTAMLDASKLEKVQLQAQVVKLKEAAKAQISRSTAAAQEAEQAWAAERDKLEARIAQLTAGSTTMKEAEQAWAAERDKLEARIVQITSESTTMTTRITLLEEQKAQVEKDLQDEREARESDSQRLTAEANDADDQYAASIAELEAKLEELSKALKAAEEDSNKQAGQVTSLKEELELVRSEEKNLRDEFAALERKLATQQAESQSKIQELNSLLELERSAHATLRKEMKEMRAELDAAKKTIEDLRSALAEAEAKAEKLGEEHQAALRAEQQRFLDETSATREELMKERDDATARLGQMATRIAGLEAQIDELSKALKAAEQASEKAAVEDDEDYGEISYAALSATRAAAESSAKVKELESKVKELEEKLAASEVGDLLEKLAAAEALIPQAVVTAEFAQQFESDEANQHRLELSTIRGQMSVLTARLMSLGKETTITEEDIANEQGRFESEDITPEGVAIRLTEEWNEEDIDKSHDQEGIVDAKSDRVVKDYKMISNTLRMRCQMLVAKGQAARARIMALENELATALNDKEAMDQWARICHKRATGAEEARVIAMEELRDIKQRTRAIRLGQQTKYESENVEIVAAAAEIEQLKERALQVEEELNLCKVQLEDAERQRDRFHATIEAEVRRKKVKGTWDSLVSPKGVLGRMGLTPARDSDEEEVTTPPMEGEGIDKLNVSGSEAAAAIEAVEIESPAVANEEEREQVVAKEPEKPESPAAGGGFFGFFGFSSTKTESTEPAEASTTTKTTETTETTETTTMKMATESSSVVVEEKAKEVEDAPKKKAGFSLGAALDRRAMDSDDDDEEVAVVPAPPPAEKSESDVAVSSDARATESRTVEREEETITTTVTKTITTTIVVNSDGEEEEIVEEHVEETVDEERKANDSVVDDATATNTTVISEDDDTGGNSFWARMNAKAGEVSDDSVDSV